MDCRKDIDDNMQYLRSEHDKRQEYISQMKAALLIQSRFRGLKNRRHYARARYGATKLAAALRGKQNRSKFNKEFSVVRRPFKIKLHRAWNLRAADKGGTSDPVHNKNLI